MPTIAELNTKVDELQTAIDAEQEQVKTLLAEKDETNTALQADIVSLNEVIATLQTQIADGGTVEERQALLDKIVAVKEDIESTVAP